MAPRCSSVPISSSEGLVRSVYKRISFRCSNLTSSYHTPYYLETKNSRRALGCSVLLSPLSHLQKLDQELLHGRFLRLFVPKTHLPGCYVTATIFPSHTTFLITRQQKPKMTDWMFCRSAAFHLISKKCMKFSACP
jgi:hypothetical protein